MNQQYWHECFEYHNGALVWKADRPMNHFTTSKGRNIWMSICAGREAGSMTHHGYLCVNILKKKTMVHRVIYEMFHGAIPSGMQIDHKNRNKLDNRIENLELVTASKNGLNKPGYGVSGLKGVHFDKWSGKWRAEIAIIGGGKRKLGRFDNEDDAYAAYCKAALESRGQDAILF